MPSETDVLLLLLLLHTVRINNTLVRFGEGREKEEAGTRIF